METVLVIVPKGLEVAQGYSITYYDSGLGQEVTKSNIAYEVTNYDYENQIQEDKRNIYVLNPSI